MPAEHPPGTSAAASELHAEWRRRIIELSLPLGQDTFPRGERLLVLSGCGDTETGYHETWPRSRSVGPENARRVLAAEQEIVVEQFIRGLEMITEGVRDRSLIDDGTSQFAVALIVAEGSPDVTGVPIAGFAVECNPARLEDVSISPCDLEWVLEDLVGPPAITEEGASKIPEATIRAYQNALYNVATAPPFCLRVDQPSSELKHLYGEHGLSTAAFLTACNPLGRRHAPKVNDARQRQLRAHLQDAGLYFLDGEGRDPEEKWSGEPSFLVLGISLDQAKAIGIQFGQNAILWAGGDTVPRLALLR
jgi:hypothetical protein